MQPPISTLPLELLELICDVSADEIDRHHVRAQLRSCCVAFRSNLKPQTRVSHSVNDRTIFWLKHDMRIDWLITHGLVNKSNILTLIIISGRNDLQEFARIFTKLDPVPESTSSYQSSRCAPCGPSSHNRSSCCGPTGPPCGPSSHNRSSCCGPIGPPCGPSSHNRSSRCAPCGPIGPPCKPVRCDSYSSSDDMPRQDNRMYAVGTMSSPARSRSSYCGKRDDDLAPMRCDRSDDYMNMSCNNPSPYKKSCCVPVKKSSCCAKRDDYLLPPMRCDKRDDYMNMSCNNPNPYEKSCCAPVKKSSCCSKNDDYWSGAKYPL